MRGRERPCGLIWLTSSWIHIARLLQEDPHCYGKCIARLQDPHCDGKCIHVHLLVHGVPLELLRGLRGGGHAHSAQAKKQQSEK